MSFTYLFPIRQKGLKVWYCPRVRVAHMQKQCFEDPSLENLKEEYYARRKERWPSFIQYIFRKWDLAYILDEQGNRITETNGRILIDAPTPLECTQLESEVVMKPTMDIYNALVSCNSEIITTLIL